MSYFVFYSVSYVSCGGPFTSVGKRELICLLSLPCYYSSWCLGWAALFYSGTAWAFHITILHEYFFLKR